jgi:hypothetical protein
MLKEQAFHRLHSFFSFQIYPLDELKDFLTIRVQFFSSNGSTLWAQMIDNDGVFIGADYRIQTASKRPDWINLAPTLRHIIEKTVSSAISQQHVATFVAAWKSKLVISCLLKESHIFIGKKHFSFSATDTAMRTTHGLVWSSAFLIYVSQVWVLATGQYEAEVQKLSPCDALQWHPQGGPVAKGNASEDSLPPKLVFHYLWYSHVDYDWTIFEVQIDISIDKGFCRV